MYNLDFKIKLLEKLVPIYHKEVNIRKSGRPRSDDIITSH